MKVFVLVASCVILASGNTLQGRAKVSSGAQKITPNRPHPACTNVSETKFVDFNHERILCVVRTAKSLLKQVKRKTPTSPPSRDVQVRLRDSLDRSSRKHLGCRQQSTLIDAPRGFKRLCDECDFRSKFGSGNFSLEIIETDCRKSANTYAAPQPCAWDKGACNQKRVTQTFKISNRNFHVEVNTGCECQFHAV